MLATLHELHGDHMNSTNSEPSSNGEDLFRWYAHPLTTIIVAAGITVLFNYTIGTAFAVTAFAGILSFATNAASAHVSNTEPDEE